MADDRSYWERHAANYDRSMVLLGRPMAHVLELAALGVSGKREVLEVAAGTGLITTAIAPRVERLIATDYAAAMIERLQRRVRECGFQNVRCETADIYRLQFPAETFDAVVAANVLHLVPDLDGAIAALRRVLKPGGTLIVPTYCHDQTPVSWVVSRLLALTGFPGHRRFTLRSLKQALERAGLTLATAELLPGVIPIGYVAGTFEYPSGG